MGLKVADTGLGTKFGGDHQKKLRDSMSAYLSEITGVKGFNLPESPEQVENVVTQNVPPKHQTSVSRILLAIRRDDVIQAAAVLKEQPVSRTRAYGWMRWLFGWKKSAFHAHFSKVSKTLPELEPGAVLEKEISAAKQKALEGLTKYLTAQGHGVPALKDFKPTTIECHYLELLSLVKEAAGNDTARLVQLRAITNAVFDHKVDDSKVTDHINAILLEEGNSEELTNLKTAFSVSIEVDATDTDSVECASVVSEEGIAEYKQDTGRVVSMSSEQWDEQIAGSMVLRAENEDLRKANDRLTEQNTLLEERVEVLERELTEKTNLLEMVDLENSDTSNLMGSFRDGTPVVFLDDANVSIIHADQTFESIAAQEVESEAVAALKLQLEQLRAELDAKPSEDVEVLRAKVATLEADNQALERRLNDVNVQKDTLAQELAAASSSVATTELAPPPSPPPLPQGAAPPIPPPLPNITPSPNAGAFGGVLDLSSVELRSASSRQLTDRPKSESNALGEVMNQLKEGAHVLKPAKNRKLKERPKSEGDMRDDIMASIRNRSTRENLRKTQPVERKSVQPKTPQEKLVSQLGTVLKQRRNQLVGNKSVRIKDNNVDEEALDSTSSDQFPEFSLRKVTRESVPTINVSDEEAPETDAASVFGVTLKKRSNVKEEAAHANTNDTVPRKALLDVPVADVANRPDADVSGAVKARRASLKESALKLEEGQDEVVANVCQASTSARVVSQAGEGSPQEKEKADVSGGVRASMI